MAAKEKVVSLEEYLLNSRIDLSVDKPRLLTVEEGLNHASEAWQKEEKGIRAVLESRAMELRHKILFTCDPVELPSLRERLVEIANIITLFKDAVPAAERLAKAKEAGVEKQEEEDSEAGDDNLEL